MSDPTDLTSEWGQALSEPELVEVIGSHFRDSRARGLDAVEYGDEGNAALTFIYKGLELTRIEAGPGLTTDLYASITAAVAREAASSAAYVRRFFVFSNIPTQGWWRYGERFQLVEAPEQAPRAPFLAAKHPLVLETVIKDSTMYGVKSMREQRALRQLSLLLNALNHFGIEAIGNHATRHWVLSDDITTRPMAEAVNFAQEGYGIDDYPVILDGFSNTSGLASIPIEPHVAHFTRLGIDAGGRFSVADSLADLLDTFWELSLEKQLAFERASYWLAHSDAVRPLSSSASYAALVQAIEALLPGDNDAPLCPECRRPVGPGITRRYMDFIEHYAPGIETKERRELYAVRSKISHGGELLHSDFGPRSFSMGAKELDEFRILHLVHAVTRRAIVNWLASRHREPIPLIVDWPQRKLRSLRTVRIGPIGSAASTKEEFSGED